MLFQKMISSIFSKAVVSTFVAFVLCNFHVDCNKQLQILEHIKVPEYPFETHLVETPDGYILTIFRIPYGKNNSYNNITRTPVLLMHGLLDSGASFLVLGNNSISYLLADQGYDVWLGNDRGTTWSRTHKILNPEIDTENYWNFSWHEIGTTDLPTIIDYILSTTKQKLLQYVGFSQGITSIVVLLSEKPEYNEKIKLISALCPAIFWGEIISPVLIILAENLKLLEYVRSQLGLHEFLGASNLITKLAKPICLQNWIFCSEMMQYILGPWHQQTITRETFEVFPAGSSTKQLLHYLQILKANDFFKYDYGENENLKMYGQKYPPKYDFSKIITPVAVYYSVDDWLITQKSNERLIQVLPNVVRSLLIKQKGFNHGCFMYCINATKTLFYPMIETMNKYK